MPYRVEGAARALLGHNLRRVPGNGLCTIAAVFCSACVQTTRVDDTVTTAKLAAARKAVAVMRLGSASPACVDVAVLLGVREGAGFRRGQVVTVANVRSLAQSQVAEVELDPGEHHVIGYKCVAEKGATAITDPSSTNGLYRTSYAHFALAPGEIVNVGYFHFGASHEGRSLFGRAIRSDIEISDWPLAEIERFKQTRPAVYSQMKTRLMTLEAGGDPAAACDTWRRLQAEGKAQSLPPECGGAAPAKKVIHGGT